MEKICKRCGKTFTCTESNSWICKERKFCYCYECQLKNKSSSLRNIVERLHSCFGIPREKVLIDLMVVKIRDEKEVS